jgi:hypothetical protein
MRGQQLKEIFGQKDFGPVDPALDFPTVNPADFVESTFDNLVDHFDFQNDSTYKQRIWTNDVYFTDPKGPNFLYICGESRCGISSHSLYPFMVGA